MITMTFERFNEILSNEGKGKGALTSEEVTLGWHFCWDNQGSLINTRLQVKFPIQERCECLCYSTTL